MRIYRSCMILYFRIERFFGKAPRGDPLNVENGFSLNGPDFRPKAFIKSFSIDCDTASLYLTADGQLLASE